MLTGDQRDRVRFAKYSFVVMIKRTEATFRRLTRHELKRDGKSVWEGLHMEFASITGATPTRCSRSCFDSTMHITVRP